MPVGRRECDDWWTVRVAVGSHQRPPSRAVGEKGIGRDNLCYMGLGGCGLAQILRKSYIS